MKIISFNIRCSNDENGNSIAERAVRLKKILANYRPDVIGFQEATPVWMPLLENDYAADYDIFYHYRDTTGWVETPPILWKRSCFNCLDNGYFWLSDTPHIPSKGWDETGYNRICLWVKLQERATGKVFYHFNTHFGFGEACQTKSAELLANTAAALGGSTTVVTGDFNLYPTDSAYKTLTAYFTDVNAVTANDWQTTFHNYGKITAGEHIDYCFLKSDELAPLNSKIIRDTVNGQYPSDHYGLLSEFSWR